jgi:enoyl-CoA hydratase
MTDIIRKVSNRTGYIILNKENNNALNSNDLKEINSALNIFYYDKNVDLIVIESKIDNCFCSGTDIEEIKEFDEAKAKIFSSAGQSLVKKIRTIKKTVLCKIDGICYGAGFEIALNSDIIFATEDSKFGFSEVNLGIIPGFGGSILFTRKIYETFVKYLVFTGNDISAKELFEKGIINKVCKNREELNEITNKFATDLGEKSIFALGLAKETINSGMDTNLQNALLIEQNAFTVAFSSNDKKEGMTAFIEKRKPVFRDRWEDIEKI